MKGKKTGKVLAFGTFDLLHEGHLFYLKNAASLGDKLIVVIARDKTVEKIKGFKPVKNEKSRLKIIKALKYVDEALLGLNYFDDKTKVVKKVNPDVIAFGYDLRNKNEVKKHLKEEGIKAKNNKIELFTTVIFWKLSPAATLPLNPVPAVPAIKLLSINKLP